MLRLRVLTLNVWSGVPFVSRDDVPRLRAIARALPALAPDLAAFQEVWSRSARAALEEGARAAGLRPIAGAPGRPAGGLMIASSFPVRDVGFTPYGLSGPPHHLHHGDWLGGKGLLRATVRTTEGDVVLAATHLQAQYAPGAVDVDRHHRIGQIVELAEALSGLREPVVMLGDFNLLEDEDDYAILHGLSRLTDAAAALDRRQPTLLSGNPYRRHSRKPDERIDYVFVRDGLRVEARPRAIRRVLDDPPPGLPAHSDHAGLLAEVEVGPRTQGTHPAAPSLRAVVLADELLRRARADADRRRRNLRAGAAVGIGSALVALAARRRISRRDLLGRGLHATALASLGLTGLSGVISEGWGGAEADAFRQVRAKLDALQRLA